VKNAENGQYGFKIGSDDTVAGIAEIDAGGRKGAMTCDFTASSTTKVKSSGSTTWESGSCSFDVPKESFCSTCTVPCEKSYNEKTRSGGRHARSRSSTATPPGQR